MPLDGQVAEREGFEPSIRFCRILTFQASAFDHSATAPHVPEGSHLVSRTPEGKRSGEAGFEAGQALPAASSIRRARATSLAVSPPSLWVVRKMSTRFQLFDQSG